MPGIHGFGSKLRRGGTAGTAVANVTSIRGPGLRVDTADVSAHDSPSAFEEAVAGIIRSGEVTLDINFEPDDVTHDETSGGLASDLKARTSQSWAIEYPTSPATFITFTAFVTGLEPAAPFDDKISATVTLKPTGVVTVV
jgi:predicted secreted protein